MVNNIDGKFIWITLLVFLFALINASALTIPISNIQLNTTIDEPLEYCLPVTNDANVTYYNISITNFAHRKIDLNASQTNDFCFNVTRSETGIIEFEPVIYGFYTILYEAEPQTRTINLIDLQNHTILENDIVEFCNNYAEVHTIKELPDGLTFTINPSECINRTDITYTQEIQDLTSMQIGYINVESNIIRHDARDNSKEPQFDLTIKTSFPNSSLYLTTLDNVYTAPFNQTITGILHMKNDGLAVEGIRFETHEWISMQNTSINLMANESKYVFFNINPQVDESFMTNKKYNLSIKAEVENLKTAYAYLEIFVPYYSFSNETVTENGTIIIIRSPSSAEIKAYMKTSEGKDLIEWYCFEDNGTREECIRTRKIYTDSDLNRTLNLRFDKLEQKVTNNGNKIDSVKYEELNKTNEYLKDISENQNNLTQNYDDKLSEVAKGEEIRQEEKRNWSKIVIIILIIIVIIVGSIFGYRAYHTMKNRAKR